MNGARLIPSVTNNPDLFVSPEHVAPWLDKDAGYMTSALQFGKKFDLLGLCTTPMGGKGLPDQTDSIDVNIALAAVHYRFNGRVYRAELNNGEVAAPLTMFIPADSGNYHDVILDFKGSLPHEGDTIRTARIAGRVNLQFGTVDMHGTSDTVSLLGYELLAFRVNHNRRPVSQTAA